LDRIDLHIEVPSVPYEDLAKPTDGLGSAEMREQVFRARAVQAARFGGKAGGLNSRMTPRELRRYCQPDEEGRGLLRSAMDDLGLSARAHDRILRVARTIADLDGSDALTGGHVAEAIGFRTLDRKLWEK
jgi:magnesium chelatase family protein